jgi:hypothetical protein
VVASAPDSPAGVEANAEPDATMAAVAVAPASADAAPPEASDAASATGAADDPDADPGSKAVRATVLIVAALTVRRGGSRIRKSLRASSVRSARS